MTALSTTGTLHEWRHTYDARWICLGRFLLCQRKTFSIIVNWLSGRLSLVCVRRILSQLLSGSFVTTSWKLVFLSAKAAVKQLILKTAPSDKIDCEEFNQGFLELWNTSPAIILVWSCMDTLSGHASLPTLGPFQRSDSKDQGLWSSRSPQYWEHQEPYLIWMSRFKTWNLAAETRLESW